jgi:hypothetical protein
MQEGNNQDHLHDEIRHHMYEIPADQDRHHTPGTDTDLDRTQETGINQDQKTDHTRETEHNKVHPVDHIQQIGIDLVTIHHLAETIQETEIDHHLVTAMTTTTNPHHQDLIQDLNQQEEQNWYQIQVQKLSSSLSTGKNTSLYVRKTNSGLSLIFALQPSTK